MSKRTVLKISALISGVSGIIILFSTLYPIYSYEMMSRKKFPQLVSPLASDNNSTGVRLEDFDYTKASNWFVGGAEKEDFSASKVGFYTLSIPKLDIENATVAIGGEDLSKSLIQYPGTSLPGKIGNAVIFGHSILPKFYDPKNYLAIFSTLPTLEKGDEIRISYDGVSYLYRVEDMFEVLPTDLEVLEQDKNASYLSLVTCTPPGDPRKLKRLIVRAKIVPWETSNANTWN
jgi:sortase A